MPKLKITIASLIILSGVFFLANISQAAVILQDGFEYAANKISNTNNNFVNVGPWVWLKDDDVEGNCTGANGKIDTVTSIPGYVGSFPGTIGGNSRAVRYWLKAGTCNNQTDTYLGWGNSAGPLGQLPPNIWIQFWVYPQDYGVEQSRWYGYNKLIYPSLTDVNTNFPVWLLQEGPMYGRDCPDMNELYCPGVTSGWDGGWYIFQMDGVGPTTAWYTSHNRYSFDHQDCANYAFKNTWTLVKIHVDHSSTSGVWQVWLKHLGDTSWHQTTNITDVQWDPVNEVHGVSNLLGHRTFILIVQQPGHPLNPYADAYAYFDDFIITTTEAELPTYGGGDTTPPTVSMTAPANGATVSGTSVTVSADASDNVGVVGVQFKLDGANLGAEDITFPYSITWDTTSTSNGSHTLTATARDAAGNQTTSSGVTVTVSNDITPPAPPSGVTVS